MKSKCVVEYADLTIETIIDVSCQSFASALASHKEQKTFYEGETYFKLIDSSFSYFRPAEDENIDVRLKVALTKGDSTKTVCMDQFGNFYDSASQRLYTNETLRKVLFEIIE